MDQNPQIIFERARRLYAEKIPTLIERERAKGDGWDDASGHLSTLYLIEAITEDEYCSAMTDLSAAMLEHLRSKAPAIEEPSPTKSPLQGFDQSTTEEAMKEPDYAPALTTSRIPNLPTIVITAPQGSGKSIFAAALGEVFRKQIVIDGEEVNGQTVETAEEISKEGALVIGSDLSGGDLEITAHTQAGFDALITALGIPLEHRQPFTCVFARGPGPAFSRETSRSKTASASSGVALSSKTD